MSIFSELYAALVPSWVVVTHGSHPSKGTACHLPHFLQPQLRGDSTVKAPPGTPSFSLNLAFQRGFHLSGFNVSHDLIGNTCLVNIVCHVPLGSQGKVQVNKQRL